MKRRGEKYEQCEQKCQKILGNFILVSDFSTTPISSVSGFPLLPTPTESWDCGDCKLLIDFSNFSSDVDDGVVMDFCIESR